jgi:Ino eighty subunit 2
LLKKQPPKRGRRTEINESGLDDDFDHERANPLYVRYIQNAKGTQLAVPDEWLLAPAGRVLAGNMRRPEGEGAKMGLGRMVMEVV